MIQAIMAALPARSPRQNKLTSNTSEKLLKWLPESKMNSVKSRKMMRVAPCPKKVLHLSVLGNSHKLILWRSAERAFDATTIERGARTRELIRPTMFNNKNRTDK